MRAGASDRSSRVGTPHLAPNDRHDQREGEDVFVGADVADASLGTGDTTLVGGRAAGVVAVVDGRTARQESVGRRRPAIVLKGAKQGVRVGQVAGSVQAARVVAVDIVA